MHHIGFTIVGFGTIAKTHLVALRTLPIIKRLPVTPVLDSLVTRRPETLAEQAKQIGFQFVTDKLETALERGQSQAVSICTPNALHAEQVKTAMNFNQALYCEKPVTESAEQTAKLLATVPAHYPQQLAFTFRYHPAVMRIRECLKEGMIGDVLQCNIAYMRSGYLNADRPFSWRLSDELSGGGAITDIGVHALDLVRHWFGNYKHVEGRTHTFVKNRPISMHSSEQVEVNVDDWASMHIETETGVRGSIEVSRIAYGSDAFRIHIVGTKGSMTCDLEKDRMPDVHLISGAVPSLPIPDSLELLPDEKATLGVFQDSHFAALHHFILRMTGDNRWADIAPTLSDGYTVERWVDKVIASSKQTD
ncbi:Gfo/Idh/MocA family oxidoreductase [Paenibacillus sp. SC116]|uniref:Gfo/Idh/MocA family protein n=1 Tax=Paenibacillus sp. SC116 TaxID=2968986 RepID=UPI00215B0FCD|nr:Gfo/Idh/MocA family oxidoreductase [Paenibacillus sp. SC116]MCR8842818.1 Gfo/Idh/MocA family oxidoreductase [Paenibacillus sp. SC116]